MYLLDTAYLIDLVRGKAGAVGLARRIDEEGVYVAISVATYHEYMLGVFLSHRRKERLKEMLKRAELELTRFDILPYSVDIARRTAEIYALLLKEGKTLPLADVIIACTALEYRLNLVTRNVEHFSRIPGLEIVSY